jgi:hypothetical protein
MSHGFEAVSATFLWCQTFGKAGVAMMMSGGWASTKDKGESRSSKNHEMIFRSQGAWVTKEAAGYLRISDKLRDNYTAKCSY